MDIVHAVLLFDIRSIPVRFFLGFLRLFLRNANLRLDSLMFKLFISIHIIHEFWQMNNATQFSFQRSLHYEQDQSLLS